MSLKKERFIKGIIIAPDTIALDGLEGEIKVDSATGKIQTTLKDGVNPSAAREIITSSQTQTLTNKTLDVDNNSVSNIEVDNLKAGVLNVSGTLSAASDTQVPSALATKTYSDSVASTAASNLSSHASTSSGVHGVTGSIVGTSDSQALTNKTINADLNTISNIDNADIKAGAAIDASKIADGSVSNAEFQYLGNVTSDIQTQINSKEPSFATLPVSKGGTNSSTALNNNRVIQSSGGAIVEAPAITASRALISDANGIPTHSSVTSTELGYSSGVTSGIQTQLDAKVDEVGGTFTSGSVITPIRSDVKQDTKANLTTYALTAANGQLVFATDTKEMFQVVDGTLKAVGGGGGVSDVDSLLIQPFDTSALTDFTQTGLELIETNPLDGTKSARLVHQAASTRSFKQTVAVPPKFRGVNMTASLTIRSSASQGNVTIVFRDETNSVDYPSQQLQTNSQAIASLVTNATTLVSGFSNSSINTLKVGMTVTGSGIPTGTTIASINTTALTITLSQAATASATVSLRFSDLPRTLQLGFTIPANCSSYSYTISALQESGSPETYIDDLVLKNYWLGMSNQGQSTVSLQTANVTAWQQYTPTFTGFGTPSAVEFEWRQVGENVEIRGKFVSGTTTAVEARISLPAGLTSAGTGVIPSIQVIGQVAKTATDAGLQTLIEPSVTYVTFGFQNASAAGLTKQNANIVVASGQALSFTASVPCAGLTATSTQSFVTTDLVPAKAVFGNTSLDIPNVTAWQGYTPTFQGFGTPTNVEFEWRQVGEDVEVRGKFVAGTTTAVEARVGLPAGLTSAGTSLIPSIQVVGKGNRASGNSTDFSGRSVLIEPSVTYFTFGAEASLRFGLSKDLASNFIGSSEAFSFFAKVPCAGLSAVSTKTIGTTQSGIVQEEDSYLQMSNATSSANVIDFSTTVSSMGSAISKQGNTFVIQKSGTYSIGAVLTFSGVDARVHITKNSTSVTNTDASVLAWGATHNTGGYDAKANWSGYLIAGDIIRLTTASGLSASNSNQKLFISYQGSLKQVSVSSDQKITIPTSELRFEGASARGSTATAIVRFDTMVKLRGDAFTVVSDAANGTAITMLKAGKLDVSATLVSSTTNRSIGISKNQSVLTGFPTLASESMAQMTQSLSGGLLHAATSFNVAVGDIIRICSDASPAANITNILSLSFQEQEIAVSVSNTLPQFSESDSSVRVDTANGYGSPATKIRRFSNVRDNIGADIEYVPSAVNGDSFVVKSTGLYSISYTDILNSASNIGISKNASSLTTNIVALPIAERLLIGTTSATDFSETASIEAYLVAGDVIRAHTNGTATGSVPALAQFTISKVGKPNVTGVNVTPFINVPQPDTEYLYYRGIASSFLDGTAEVRFPIGGISSTNKGIIRIDDDATNTRTKFTAIKNCIVDVSWQSKLTTLGNETYIYKNGALYISGSMPSTAGYASVATATLSLVAGDFVSVGSSNNLNVGDQNTFCMTATAQSDQILTAPESFSTDTASLQYASSSQYTLSTLSSAPVGTYITFTYAANTNTRTQTSTRPTQTDADMNVNGMLIYTRTYNAASTAAQPAVIAIQIGKGLKGLNLGLYKNTSKAISGEYDEVVQDSSAAFGFGIKSYNELTGILQLDAGYSRLPSNTVRRFLFSDLTEQASGYLVINASKSPALTGVPAVLPRIATLSDVKPSGTDGGTFTGGSYQTRILNTVEDLSGIVTSLASNQFTLPAGQYYVEFSAPAYAGGDVVQHHKAKIRNITDSTDAIIGSVEINRRISTASVATNRSFGSGYITINSNKIFELQHRCVVTATTNGFGTTASFGDNEVYSIVKITRVR